MFVQFFYMLRERGVPVTPTSFLRLQKALSLGVISSVDDFYTAARSILVKSERYFDTYDQVFAHYFKGAAIGAMEEVELTDIARALLEEWLKHPQELAEALGLDEKELAKYTPEELIRYFLERLKEQTEAHHGGNYWIGTGGTSPFGHSGHHPGGMRVGGASRNKSAVKVAMERRYKDYSQEGPLTELQIGEALKRLRRLIPHGPRDVVNVDKTITETMKSGGEISIVFDRRLADRLKVILMIDNGGWSMDPYIEIVQTLFNYARSQFKDLRIYYFHNTLYGRVWSDPQRHLKPEAIEEFARRDPDTRLIIVGDAAMAPSELNWASGGLYVEQTESKSSEERLKFLARTFRHAVWLNPQAESTWGMTWTIGAIGKIFPMFELTLDGLEKAVQYLIKRN
ncbi:MAG: vWA domain-containing protein [Syntrophales bacterium]